MVLRRCSRDVSKSGICLDRDAGRLTSTRGSLVWLSSSVELAHLGLQIGDYCFLTSSASIPSSVSETALEAVVRVGDGMGKNVQIQALGW